MRTFLFKWLTVIFAAALASSLVSMMAAFVGSEGQDLQDLLRLQAAVVLIAVAVTSTCLAALVRQYGLSGALRAAWRELPGWLLFSVVAVNSLVLIAELSFVLIQYHTGNARPWQEHLPAATALAASVALAVCYVSYRLSVSAQTLN